MKYLKSFENHLQYESYTADTTNFIKPNVSLCVNENEVHYNPSTPPTPPTPTHDYVEIGGIKWATMNIGANSVTDSGLYFQWADTSGYTTSQVGSGEGKKYFGWVDYKYTNDYGDTMTKYNDTDGETVLDSEDDAAQTAWGGNWRMPTIYEWQTLGEAVNNGDVTTAWTSNYQGSGVAGVTFTDANDSSKVLFFPAAGKCDYGSANGEGSYGMYWSKSLYGYDEEYDYKSAFYTYFDNDLVDWSNGTQRLYGCSVRGVLDE